MTPEETLLAAADVINQRGWCQGELKDKNGAVCAMGAICSVAQWQSREALDAHRLLIAEIGCGTIVGWNDAPERTAEDVILTMKKAANHE